jgi:hypothetical protein
VAGATSSPQTPTAGTGFSGISAGESFCGCYPPDGAVGVGPSDVVGAVNTAFKIWNTSGTVLVPATALSSLFHVNSACKANISDPGVQYDPANGGHFVIEALTYDNSYNSAICMAVSVNGDPTGSYWVYGFTVNVANDLLDFPQFAIGSDAIYLSGNQFQNGATFSGARVYAYNKAQVESGQAAQSVYKDVGNDAIGYPADTLYPAKGVTTGGAYFLAPDNNFSSGNSISLWKWTDPFGANSFTLQGGVTVNTYTQPPKATEPGGTTDTGDTRNLGAAYYNGTLYGVHTTGCTPSGSSSAVPCIQWYQVGNIDSAPSLIQQGIVGAAGTSYYYPNLVVDKAGDMLMGYAYASTTAYPGVHYTGRQPGDTAGTLQPEGLFKAGEATINGTRYGDYAGIQLAPDGCTVYHLEEYAQSGQLWGTWVGNMSFSSCSAPTTAPTAPTNLTATGGNNQVSLSWTGSSGATSYNVKRSTTSGGPYTTISPAGGVTTPSYSDSTAANGTTYYYVVSAVNSVGESANSNEASATPAPPPPPGAPTNLTATAGNGQVSLSWTGSSGATSYNIKRGTSPDGETLVASGVTMTSYVDSGLSNGTTYYYVVTAVNSSGESSNSNEANATPTAPPPDFSLSASPTSSSMSRFNGSTSYTVSVVPVNGYTGSVTLSVSGQPSGVSVSWRPSNTATPGSPATLSLTSSGAPRGNYTLTITGTDGTNTHTAQVTLTITKH